MSIPLNPGITGPQFYTGLANYDDPVMATFQRYRESRGWWVCPRNPFVDGFKVDYAPFYDGSIRRHFQSPAKYLWGMTYVAFVVGMLKPQLLKNGSWVSALDSASPGIYRRNWDTRLSHQWAMRKLTYLRAVRPALGMFTFLCLYWIPRELFAQNFGRRNRRFWQDFADHAVGCASLMMFGRYIFGTWTCRFLICWVGGAYIFNEHHWAYSGHAHNMTKEMAVPRRMAQYYGLPDGGEGYDVFEGAEMAYTYRTESQNRRWYLAAPSWKVRNHTMYENHPWYRQDHGWGLYLISTGN